MTLKELKAMIKKDLQQWGKTRDGKAHRAFFKKYKERAE